LTVLSLKAVLFDLGGTLIITAPVPEIFRRILAAHGIHKPLEKIASAFRRAEEEVELNYTLSYVEFWRLFNRKILEQLGIRRNIEALADAVTDEWWDNADLNSYPEVKETLMKLKQKGLKTGIITNGYQKDVDEVLLRTGLNGLFDVTVGADNVQKPKPSKEIFLYALEKLRVQPQDAVFVGDNPKADYEGARNVGLKPLLIDRENGKPQQYATIHDLGEVLGHL